jgi:hypothetical protein
MGSPLFDAHFIMAKRYVNLFPGSIAKIEATQKREYEISSSASSLAPVQVFHAVPSPLFSVAAELARLG